MLVVHYVDLGRLLNLSAVFSVRSTKPYQLSDKASPQMIYLKSAVLSLTQLFPPTQQRCFENLYPGIGHANMKFSHRDANPYGNVVYQNRR